MISVMSRMKLMIFVITDLVYFVKIVFSNGFSFVFKAQSVCVCSCFWSPVSDRPSEPVVDVVAVVRGDRSLPWPAELPLHSVLSETLRLAAAERLCLPQLPKGTITGTLSFLSLIALSFSIFCLTPRYVQTIVSCLIFLLFLLRYVRTTVLIWTLVRRGRCWVCWWTLTVVSTSMSTAWTRVWRRRTSLLPAIHSSTSTASVNRFGLIKQWWWLSQYFICIFLQQILKKCMLWWTPDFFLGFQV